MDGSLPCIVGVAQKTWRKEAGDAPHPLLQNVEVAKLAIADCGATAIISRIDELDAVRCLSWHYDDLPGAIADTLGLQPGERKLSGMSGTGPQRFVCDAAEKILKAERRAVLVTGAEALATRKRASRGGKHLDWPKANTKPDYPFEDPHHPSELSHELRQAYATFAILDSARRVHLGLTPEANRRQEAAMMSRLSERAAHNPLAWFPKAHSAESLYNLADNDRMVAAPFSKNTMAFMDVDMAAAILIISHALADELGIPAHKRIYLHGWGYAKSPPYIAQRPCLYDSPAMRAACEHALAMAGTSAADIEFLDLYSCFASNINFTRDVLGIGDDDPRPLTVTGGLPYFGGPGNNYTAHSIAAMVETLRQHPGSSGLVSAVGMHMTNHSFAVYSSAPRDLAVKSVREPDRSVREIIPEANGPAVIVGYTVIHSGPATHALAVCELPGGARCYARCDVPETVAAMAAQEWAGRTVSLHYANGVNSITA
jgi:acetyl-CoA C-acetyltransferase